ncbi:hypothetical protein F0U59_16395 [Archangium gephyra]|nr:hypothetical protein F0U59_16395 [Archangium gephyra]
MPELWLPVRWCVPRARGSAAVLVAVRPPWRTPPRPSFGCRTSAPLSRADALHRPERRALVASVASNAPEFRAVSAAAPLAPSAGPRFGCWLLYRARASAAAPLMRSTGPELWLLPLRWRLHRARGSAAGVLTGPRSAPCRICR